MSDVYRLRLETIDGDEVWYDYVTIDEQDSSGKKRIMNLFYPLGQVAMMGKVKGAIMEWEKGLADMAAVAGVNMSGIRSLLQRGRVGKKGD